MNKPTTTLAKLLEHVESELETANGLVRLCRDPNGGSYWIVDGAERVMSLREFAGQCNIAARQFCAQARAEWFRRMIISARQAFAGIAKALQQTRAKTARA
jgi:hypothetical protein